MEAQLEVRNLSVKFGGIDALKDVSFSIKPGEFVGLMGANGAGKTTLINCIARVHSYSDGEILFGNQLFSKLKPHDIFKLGIARTFQDLGFFSRIPNMLVLDYMKLGNFPNYSFSILNDGLQTKSSLKNELKLKKDARQILEFFREMRMVFEPGEEDRGFPSLFGREEYPDLLDVEYGTIGMLSFAWRKRLDLARALVSRPRLLLLDEPAQGLPPHEIKILGKFLRLIQKEFSLGALIVEHNVATLMEISDRIVAMDSGKKIAEGTPQEINRNPLVHEVYLGNKSSITAKIEDRPQSPPREGAPLLSIRNIDLYYGRAQALYAVSLDVYPKEIISIVGTNGSGKSTVLKAIGGVETPAFGQIYFKEEEMPLGLPESGAEKGIQFVPQGHLVFPNLTVFENLRVCGLLAEKRGHKIKAGLERVFHYFPQLSDLQTTLATSLSGGQQQMLAIGQALMGQPDLLLLDEPSLGLAPSYVEALFSIIKKISVDSKCAVVLVEQNVQKALEICDYVYMMSSGCLVGSGPATHFIEDNSIIKKKLGFL